MGDVPLHMTIGGLAVQIPDLRRAPDIQAALGGLLRALAEEIDPEVKHASDSATEPQGSDRAPEVT